MQGIGHCKKCGQEIIFIRTSRGKLMPCDSLPVSYMEHPRGPQLIYELSGKHTNAYVNVDKHVRTGYGYVPHWGTCTKRGKDKPKNRPESADQRKRRERREKEEAEQAHREAKAAEKAERERQIKEFERAQVSLFD